MTILLVTLCMLAQAPADPAGTWVSERGWMAVIAPDIAADGELCWRMEWYVTRSESVTNSTPYQVSELRRRGPREFTEDRVGFWFVDAEDRLTRCAICPWSPLYRPRKR